MLVMNSEETFEFVISIVLLYEGLNTDSTTPGGEIGPAPTATGRSCRRRRLSGAGPLQCLWPGSLLHPEM